MSTSAIKTISVDLTKGEALAIADLLRKSGKRRKDADQQTYMLELADHIEGRAS